MKFQIDITCSVVLDESQLWPNGDGPENPTTKDVEDLIEECGGPSKIIEDWSLEDDCYLDVRQRSGTRMSEYSK